VRYQERPPRFEYRLTEKGIDLWPTVVALMQWGDRHAAPADCPAVLLEHRDCGGAVDAHRICVRCGERLVARDSRALPGPGATPDHPLIRRRRGKRPHSPPAGQLTTVHSIWPRPGRASAAAATPVRSLSRPAA
jgi:hypothetical protein